jgi:hypothetical protein
LLERLIYAEKRHYFWFGEVETAAILAGVFAAPVGVYMAGRTDMSLAFIGAAVLFLPLFVFLGFLQNLKAEKNASAFFEPCRS